MRVLFLTGWLLLPVGFGLWHYGPGQVQLRLDDVGRLLARAEKAAAKGEWSEAAELYGEALKLLPGDRVEQARRVRLERALAQMNSSQLPAAHTDLKALGEEAQADPSADPKLLARVRSALAQSQFYMAWLMRLEGLSRDEWEPEVEAARQAYRLLAEQADEAGDAVAAARNRKDLEAAVRLARMDLGELQGLPLPSQ